MYPRRCIVLVLIADFFVLGTGFAPVASWSAVEYSRIIRAGMNGDNNINGDWVNEDMINGDDGERPASAAIGLSGYTTTGYSQYLRRRWAERRMDREERQKDLQEDGYGDLTFKRRSLLRKIVKFPFRLAKRLLLPQKEPGTLILVRHGESLWNVNKTFTGWADPDISAQGYREVEHAARLLLEGGYDIDVVFTSRLKRAIRSAWIILQELDQVYLPVFKSWRLNERMYGALTGLSKTETAEQLGHDLVQKWRGSLWARPPSLQLTDKFWPGRERKYFDLTVEQIPVTESLHDCMVRAEPVWENKIKRELQRGRNVMVVAHSNTLRALVKKIDDIGDDDIQEVAIPTGIPVIYKFDKNMHPVKPSGDRQTASQIHMRGIFLEKPGLLKEALKREEEWSSQVPGYDSTMAGDKRPLTTLERSLFKLQAERELGAWAGQFFDPNDIVEDDGNDGNQGRPIVLTEDEVWDRALEGGEINGGEIDEETMAIPGDSRSVEPMGEDGDVVTPSIIRGSPCVTSIPTAAVLPGLGEVPIRRDAVVVLVRHGKTEHNKLKLFTGWEDAPLAPEGIEEAKQAGRLLKLHGFEFDVVYTSWLSRAIETAWYVIDEMDALWLPIIKSWRLNERMYGSLTGLSKRMVAQKHGEKQFKAWRRGYKTRPPAVSSFSQHYPGNDKRYQKYLNDVRYSLMESLIRTLESRKLQAVRKLPKAESLKDCMDRTIPYFTQMIVPEAINKGQRVLISSSENAIRGLLMYLCEIPEEKITGLEIPNGLPLIFDIKSKCVKLLDDGTGRDPLEVYDFGSAANYLFRPCENDDGSPDEECDIRFLSDAPPQSLVPEEQEVLAAIKQAAGIGE